MTVDDETKKILLTLLGLLLTCKMNKKDEKKKEKPVIEYDRPTEPPIEVPLYVDGNPVPDISTGNEITKLLAFAFGIVVSTGAGVGAGLIANRIMGNPLETRVSELQTDVNTANINLRFLRNAFEKKNTQLLESIKKNTATRDMIDNEISAKLEEINEGQEKVIEFQDELGKIRRNTDRTSDELQTLIEDVNKNIAELSAELQKQQRNSFKEFEDTTRRSIIAGNKEIFVELQKNSNQVARTLENTNRINELERQLAIYIQQNNELMRALSASRQRENNIVSNSNQSIRIQGNSNIATLHDQRNTVQQEIVREQQTQPFVAELLQILIRRTGFENIIRPPTQRYLNQGTNPPAPPAPMFNERGVADNSSIFARGARAILQYLSQTATPNEIARELRIMQKYVNIQEYVDLFREVQLGGAPEEEPVIKIELVEEEPDIKIEPVPVDEVVGEVAEEDIDKLSDLDLIDDTFSEEFRAMIDDYLQNSIDSPIYLGMIDPSSRIDGIVANALYNGFIAQEYRDKLREILSDLIESWKRFIVDKLKKFVAKMAFSIKNIKKIKGLMEMEYKKIIGDFVNVAVNILNPKADREKIVIWLNDRLNNLFYGNFVIIFDNIARNIRRAINDSRYLSTVSNIVEYFSRILQIINEQNDDSNNKIILLLKEVLNNSDKYVEVFNLIAEYNQLQAVILEGDPPEEVVKRYNVLIQKDIIKIFLKLIRILNGLSISTILTENK